MIPLNVGKYDYDIKRKRCDSMIRRAGFRGLLRNASDRTQADIPVSIVVKDFRPVERGGKMINPVERLVYVSALSPEDGTVNDLSSVREAYALVTLHPGTIEEDETLRIVSPIKAFKPGGVVLYWELLVRG